MKMGAWHALEPEIVRFVGQGVAVVIAETKAEAREKEKKEEAERRKKAADELKQKRMLEQGERSDGL